MADAKPISFSDREMKLMAAACQSFKGNPPLDIKKFSALSGLTEGSARNAWAALRKKLDLENASTTNSSSFTVKTPGSNRKSLSKKRGPAKAESDEDDDESPSKKKRGPTAARKKATFKKSQHAQSETDDDNDDADDNDFIKRERELSLEDILSLGHS